MLIGETRPVVDVEGGDFPDAMLIVENDLVVDVDNGRHAGFQHYLAIDVGDG